MDVSAPHRPRKPRRRWRWHVPPALVHGGESLEGVQVLDEVEGRLGVLLWETYRDVVLWGSAAPDERDGLFADGAHAARLAAIEAAGPEAGVERPLRAAAGLLRDPAGAAEEEVMASCRQIADWAEQRRLLSTAVALMAAGAVASPAHAGAAFRVGQLARRHGEGARAETWFRRAVGLGRQARDWSSYAEAFLGLGEIYQERGNYPAARRFHVRALRAARRHTLRDAQGRAMHDLFRIAVATGATADAHELARAAYRAYGPRHPRLPALAHEVAAFWMEHGAASDAFALLRAAAPHHATQAAALGGAGALGRAAAFAGDRAAFEDAWERVWSCDGGRDGAAAVPALLDLARGAAALGEWVRAERAAERAREVALLAGTGDLAAASADLADAARRKRPPAPAPETPLPDAAAELRDEMVRSLRPPGRG